MYLAKNQDKYQFALSSAHFIAWSGLGIKAYNTAFDELVDEGYLKQCGKNQYIFYDKSPIESPKVKQNDPTINVPEEKVEEIKQFNF